jgi:hypothetical protein
MPIKILVIAVGIACAGWPTGVASFLEWSWRRSRPFPRTRYFVFGWRCFGFLLAMIGLSTLFAR